MPRSLALSLLFAGFAHAQIANIPIEHYTLPNGMEVIAHVDRRAPVVYLNFRFRVGSKHEKPGQTGLAHLFEHLLFQSRDAKGEFQSAAERIGATDVNAGTNQDFTEYYENVPTSRLERMLWMESNRFANLPQNLTQERLDQQRAVVINEKRQGRENVGYGMVPVLRVENLYPLGHPYQHEVLGSYPDLHAITLHDARTFYAEHYTPDQMTLALVGNFDPTPDETMGNQILRVSAAKQRYRQPTPLHSSPVGAKGDRRGRSRPCRTSLVLLARASHGTPR